MSLLCVHSIFRSLFAAEAIEIRWHGKIYTGKLWAISCKLQFAHTLNINKNASKSYVTFAGAMILFYIFICCVDYLDSIQSTHKYISQTQIYYCIN